MRNENWNDLRYLLAVQRGRTLSAAARRLGVDNTTVTRRLRALDDSFGAPLFQRHGDGTLKLTPKGKVVARQAVIIEHHVGLMEEGLDEEQDACAGHVRITSIPILVNRLLMPRIGALVTQFPALQVDLLPESQNLSLTRREADLALRLERPKTGGAQIKARRVADLDYAIYVPVGCSPHEAETLPWITYDEAMAHVPQARWIAKETRGHTAAVASVKVRDGETLLEAVAAGLGKSLLPIQIANNDNRLVQITDDDAEPVLSRELWLLGHADQLKLNHIRAVTAWIEGICSSLKCDAQRVFGSEQ